MNIIWVKKFHDGTSIEGDPEDTVSWRNTPLEGLVSVSLKLDGTPVAMLEGDGRYWQESTKVTTMNAGKCLMVSKAIFKDVGDGKAEYRRVFVDGRVEKGTVEKTW